MSIYTTTIKMVYIYLLGLREFRITKNPIVKVGKCASYHSRFVNYPNLSEIYSIRDLHLQRLMLNLGLGVFHSN